jgi:hypothetical protein
LYARQIGWLNCTPDESKTSRRDDLTRRFVNILIPDVGPANYLVKYWHEAGTAEQGVNGPQILSWPAIRAWRKENDIPLQPFEVSFIRRMSSEYCSEYHNTAPEREAPLPIDEDDFDREAQSNAMIERNRQARLRKKQEESERYTVEQPS